MNSSSSAPGLGQPVRLGHVRAANTSKCGKWALRYGSDYSFRCHESMSMARTGTSPFDLLASRDRSAVFRVSVRRIQHAEFAQVGDDVRACGGTRPVGRDLLEAEGRWEEAVRMLPGGGRFDR